MERKTSLDEAKKIMGKNFIGPEELTKIENTMGIIVPKSFPEIQFTEIELKEKNADHILILGVSLMKNGEPVTILSLRKKFGINPETSEPCFYNQDWYIKENFANIRLASTWYLIKKNIKESLRGIDPSSKFANLKSNFFIPAILGAYTFFAWYILKNEVL